VLCAVVLIRASFRVSAISGSRYFSSATSRQSLGLIARDNGRNYSIMGKKCFVMALAVFAFGFGTALRSNAGTDMVEPYQAPARGYNYAATAAAACGLPSASSHRHLLRPGLRLLWAWVWVLRTRVRLRRPPILRSTRLLGWALSSLALTVAAVYHRRRCSRSPACRRSPTKAGGKRHYLFYSTRAVVAHRATATAGATGVDRG